LNVFIHFTHRNSALLTVPASSRILAWYTGCQHGERFSANIFAKLKIFKITQSGGLMIVPYISLGNTLFQRTHGSVPAVNILKSIAMSHTTSGKPYKPGMHIGNGLCQISTQSIFSLFKRILWEKRDHIQSHFSCKLRKYFQLCII